MKTRMLLLFWGVCHSCLLAAQPFGEFYDRLETYQNSVKLKIEYPNVGIDSATFDINDYMAIFSKLSVTAGKEIACHYSASGDGGLPLFYGWDSKQDKNEVIDQYRDERLQGFMNLARKRWEEEKLSPCERQKDSCRRMDFFNSFFTDDQIMRLYALDSANKATRFLIPEDDEMGYFQLLMFDLYGNDFALYWHANYGSRFLIRGKEQIDYLMTKNREQDFEVCLDEKQLLPLLKEDLRPQVRLEKNKCLITIYTFHVMGGIYRNTYSISRSAPHSITKEESEHLVENNMRGVY